MQNVQRVDTSRYTSALSSKNYIFTGFDDALEKRLKALGAVVEGNWAIAIIVVLANDTKSTIYPVLLFSEVRQPFLPLNDKS